MERNELFKTVKRLREALWKKWVWLSSAKFDRNQDKLHQIIRR